MEGILNYTYRGVLKACNYSCRYCPFAKTVADAAAIAADRDALFRFCNYIAQLRRAPRSLQLFLLPYGEGMIHAHYTEALARLSRLPSVRRVSCQTNLSWDVDRFARTVTEAGGNLERIAFWCSFHPQCTTREAFTARCNRLEQYGVRHCAGMVAVPGSEALAAEVRAALPVQTYMWLNRMDGLGRKYTPEETAAFRAIDPFFALELGDFAADAFRCRGGKDSVFVRADGRTALCPVAGRYMGNIYRNRPEGEKEKAGALAPAQAGTAALRAEANQEKAKTDAGKAERITANAETGSRTPRENTKAVYPAELHAQVENDRITRCNAARCSCYLAYSNRPDTGLETFFGRGAFLRIPERKAVKNIFLDIDGTLTGRNGELLSGLVPALASLAATSRLYFATELPWIYARKKCGALLRFFAGGIFAGGAHIRFFPSGRSVYTYLPAEAVIRTERLLAEAGVRESAVKRYRTPVGVYRIAVTGRLPHELVTSLSETAGVHLQAETGLVTLVSAATDKGKAVAYVLHQSGDTAGTALAVGNDTSDLAMFREVAYAVSVPGSPAQVTEASLSTLPVTLLPAFFGGSAGDDV